MALECLRGRATFASARPRGIATLKAEMKAIGVNVPGRAGSVSGTTAPTGATHALQRAPRLELPPICGFAK
jgi:hypothetical protein